jgi:pimeloyl-ACP methyl ester carboxylesterase
MLSTTIERHGEHDLRVARLEARSADTPSAPSRPLILMHGYPDNLQIFCELAPRLALHGAVIAFDWPGMGASDAWSGGASPWHMAERLVRLMDAWKIERATLIGMDMGGQPAIVAAAQWPERVERLVVMNSLVLWDEATSWEIRVLRRLGWNRALIRGLPRLVFERAVRTSLPRRAVLPPELRADLWSAFRRREVRSYVSRMCAAYQGALRRLPLRFGDVACPTLLLWGERDRHFPPRHAERLHAELRNARVELLPNGEHWMAWHQADEVATHILRFAL